MNEETKVQVQVQDVTANPAPLGLLGFGMTTILLNIHNAGFCELGSMILAMGIFYGGIAQIIAGVMEWKKNNTFGCTAFTSYGLFWLSLVALIVFPKLGWAEEASSVAMVAYLLMWGIFTMFMFIGSVKLNKALQVVFISLTLLFILLALGYATGSTLIMRIAGFEGIFCGASAIYTAIAIVLNDMYGEVLLPLGVGTRKITKRKRVFAVAILMVALLIGVPYVVYQQTQKFEEKSNYIRAIAAEKGLQYLDIQALIVNYHYENGGWPESVKELTIFSRELSNRDGFSRRDDFSSLYYLDIIPHRSSLEVKVDDLESGGSGEFFIKNYRDSDKAYIIQTNGYFPRKIKYTDYEKVQLPAFIGNDVILTLFFEEN